MDKKYSEEYVLGNEGKVLEMLSTRSVSDEANFSIPYLKDSSKILDVGCGPGSITASIADIIDDESSVWGVDFDSEQIELASRRYSEVKNLKFFNQSIYNLDFPDESFDVVFIHTLLMHLSDIERALSEVYRVVRSGGVLIVREGVSTIENFRGIKIGDNGYSLKEFLDRTLLSVGGKPDLGIHLKEIAIRAGFSIERFDAKSVCYQTPGEIFTLKEWYQSMVMGHLGKTSLKNEIVNKKDLVELSQKLDLIHLDPASASVIVWGELVAKKNEKREFYG